MINAINPDKLLLSLTLNQSSEISNSLREKVIENESSKITTGTPSSDLFIQNSHAQSAEDSLAEDSLEEDSQNIIDQRLRHIFLEESEHITYSSNKTSEKVVAKQEKSKCICF